MRNRNKVKKLIKLVESVTGKKVILKENHKIEVMTYFEGASNTLRRLISEMREEFYNGNKNKVLNFMNDNAYEIDEVCDKITELSDLFDTYEDEDEDEDEF